MNKSEGPKYHRLVIEALPQSDIWLADDGGHLVQKERGVLDTKLLPGQYTVEFELGARTYPINLEADCRYTQSEIESGPTCPRPKLKLTPLFTERQGQFLAFIYYFTKIQGEAPSEADMVRYFRVTAPTVHQMILQLESRGLIARTPGKARSISLLVGRDELPDLD